MGSPLTSGVAIRSPAALMTVSAPGAAHLVVGDCVGEGVAVGVAAREGERGACLLFVQPPAHRCWRKSRGGIGENPGQGSRERVEGRGRGRCLHGGCSCVHCDSGRSDLRIRGRDDTRVGQGCDDRGLMLAGGAARSSGAQPDCRTCPQERSQDAHAPDLISRTAVFAYRVVIAHGRFHRQGLCGVQLPCSRNTG